MKDKAVNLSFIVFSASLRYVFRHGNTNFDSEWLIMTK